MADHLSIEEEARLIGDCCIAAVEDKLVMPRRDSGDSSAIHIGKQEYGSRGYGDTDLVNGDTDAVN